MSGDERRAEVVAIAARAFAEGGLSGTSTESIARDAGISHAYLFRLFPTKRDLFVACAARCAQRITETFRATAGAHEGAGTEELLAALGSAYIELLADRELLRSQMQFWTAAAGDPELRVVAQRHYGEITLEIQRLTGLDPERLRTFIAHGMLMNVAAALSLDEIGDQEWVRWLLPHIVEQEGTSR